MIKDDPTKQLADIFARAFLRHHAQSPNTTQIPAISSPSRLEVPAKAVLSVDTRVIKPESPTTSRRRSKA